jgi:hypothetical protein
VARGYVRPSVDEHRLDRHALHLWSRWISAQFSTSISLRLSWLALKPRSRVALQHVRAEPGNGVADSSLGLVIGSQFSRGCDSPGEHAKKAYFNAS